MDDLVTALRKLVDTYGIGEVQETLSMIASEVAEKADREARQLQHDEEQLAEGDEIQE